MPKCLYVNCDREPPDGDNVCTLHAYWSRVVLADPKYRYETPPEPIEVEADMSLQGRLAL